MVVQALSVSKITLHFNCHQHRRIDMTKGEHHKEVQIDRISCTYIADSSNTHTTIRL